MKHLPKYGKISRHFFEEVVYPNLGAKRNEVMAGPAVGLDNAVINLGGGQVLLAATDPLSYIAELGPKDSAWLSVHSIASDIATSGFRPQYAMFNLNLPLTLNTKEFVQYWDAVSAECKALGIAIVGGHTGRFEGLDSTIIGAGTMLSVGSSRAYLTPASAVLGDSVLVTKGAAIETTAVLSRVFEKKVLKQIGPDLLRIAQEYIHEVSVVDDALTAIRVGLKSGGVSAMHDATEGGILAGLYELAAASSLGLKVELEKIPVSVETAKICHFFQIDPLESLSEGSLIFACNPSRAEDAVKLLAKEGIKAAVVGELLKAEEGIMKVDSNGKKSRIDYPVVDPYWAAYYRAKKNHWN